MKVLLLQQKGTPRLLMQRRLHGNTVTTCDNLNAAKRIIERKGSTFDIIICSDIPGGSSDWADELQENGYPVLSVTRARKPTHAPHIAISNRDGYQHLRRVIQQLSQDE